MEEKEKKSKKKIIIPIIIVVVLLLVGLLLFFLLGNKKVTVTFDSDGGTPVETQKIKKGGTITVPGSTKEGFVLDGWYKDDQRVTNKTFIFTDTTLKAKWISEAAKTYTITFDSKGGSEVEKLVVECEKEVKFGEAPTKEGYNFVSWVDKNETPILDGALLSCEDVTLYANWEKKEEKKEEKKYYTVTFDSKGGSKVNPIKVECGKTLTLPSNPTRSGYNFVSWYDKHGKTILTGALLSCEDITLYADWKEVEKETPKKEYKCPSGYTLNGTKCTMEGTVHEKCDGDRVYDYEGKCVTVNSASRRTGAYSCPELNITVGSYAGKEKGELVQAGTYFCYYHKLTYNTESQCTSLSGQYGKFVWRNSNSSCYVVMKNATMSCDSLSGYIYISDPNKTFSGVNGLNGGCFPVSEKTKYCDEGYTLTSGKCIKTIDATYE